MRAPSRATTPPQEVRFCRAPDGVRIAYAKHGSGPTLVISTCWLSHLQFDWESPVWRHFLESSNHILLEDEPAWPVFLGEVGAFLAADRAESRGALPPGPGFTPLRAGAGGAAPGRRCP